ncbi:MAG: hypothetical protein EPN93_21175 [Spirochaetes bacterium]|nr:MAG: hypothetical protein EPN93_21175 [Spirochaetota bacterium]
MITSRVLLFTLLAVMIASNGRPVNAQDKMSIAILDFEANDVSIFAAKAISEFISIEMAKKQDITVIERAQMKAILDEQGFQQTGCTDQACAVKLGKLLSAQKILIGSLTKTGNARVVSAKVVDVTTSKIDFAESEKCLKEEDLELASRILAVKLINQISGKNYSIPSRTYQQDEERNRFSINMALRYGMMHNVKLPSLEISNDGMVTKKATKASDVSSLSLVVSPAFQISNIFGIALDFKYLFSIDPKMASSIYQNKTVGSEQIFVYFQHRGRIASKGYGVCINPIIFYNLSGFSFHLSTGMGLDYIIIDEYAPYYSFDHRIGSTSIYSQNGYQKYSSYGYKPFCKAETGVAVYMSRFVEIAFAVGINYHFASELVTDIKLRNDGTSSTGSPPQSWKSIKNNYKGNYPPEYYIQGGLNFRLF